MKKSSSARSTPVKYSSAASSEPSGLLANSRARPSVHGSSSATAAGSAPLELLDELRGPVRPDREEVLREGLAGQVGRRLVDGVAEARAELRGGVGGGLHLRVGLVAEIGLRGEGDAEAPPVGPGDAPDRRERRAGPAALGEREQQRAVAHGARHAVVRVEPTGRIAGRVGLHAPAARLEAEHAAARGRDADRAAAVARLRERHDAGGDGRGRAAARAAGAVRGDPTGWRRRRARAPRSTAAGRTRACWSCRAPRAPPPRCATRTPVCSSRCVRGRAASPPCSARPPSR